MKQALLVFIGGGIGSVLRYLLGKHLNLASFKIPYGTFTANIIGCFLIGLVMGYALKTNWLSQNHILFLATGLCGGFTTFSAFAYENTFLLKNGDFTTALLYVCTSTIIGIAVTFLGFYISK